MVLPSKKLKSKKNLFIIFKIRKKKTIITENIKKTDAQLAFEESKLKKKKEGKLKKKTYKEKVEEFNKQMEKKTEQ